MVVRLTPPSNAAICATVYLRLPSPPRSSYSSRASLTCAGAGRGRLEEQLGDAVRGQLGDGAGGVLAAGAGARVADPRDQAPAAHRAILPAALASAAPASAACFAAAAAASMCAGLSWTAQISRGLMAETDVAMGGFPLPPTPGSGPGSSHGQPTIHGVRET